MIYKVVFKRKENTGINIIETSFKGIKRVSTDSGNGITLLGSRNEMIAFIPNESLLYVEKVEVQKTSFRSRLVNLQEGDQIYVERNSEGGLCETFTVIGVDERYELIEVHSKNVNGAFIVNVPFKDVSAVLPSLNSWNKGYGIRLIERG